MIQFEYFTSWAQEQLGEDFPGFFSERDPRPARAQAHSGYQMGWSPFTGFRLNREDMTLNFPGDPPVRPIAKGKLREETIMVYEHDWVMILQPDGEFEVARMD